MSRLIDLTPQRVRQLWYPPVLSIAMGLMMLRLFFMARLLDVQAFAEFSGAILLSSTFCMFGSLGLQSMLMREWPSYYLRQQERHAVIRAVQCNLVALGMSIATSCCVITGLALAGLGPQLLVLSAVNGFAQQMFLVITIGSRSRGDTLAYAWQQLLRAGCAFALGAAAAFIFGTAAAVIAVEALVSASLSFRLLHTALQRTSLSWSAVHMLAWRGLSKINWSSALTLMMVMMVAFAMLNADRWVAAHLLDRVEFARYSFVAIVLAVAQALQALINASIYPLLARRYAQLGREAAYSTCLRACVAALIVGGLTAIPLMATLEYVIEIWYPRYTAATSLVPLLLMVGVLRVSDFWSSYLVIIGNEGKLLRLNVVAGICAVFIWSLCVMPWQQAPISLQEIGLLAALLSAFSYVLTAHSAWRLRRS